MELICVAFTDTRPRTPGGYLTVSTNPQHRASMSNLLPFHQRCREFIYLAKKNPPGNQFSVRFYCRPGRRRRRRKRDRRGPSAFDTHSSDSPTFLVPVWQLVSFSSGEAAALGPRSGPVAFAKFFKRGCSRFVVSSPRKRGNE